jgi:nucleoside-diphosphate-sugar epimerase
MTVPERRLLVFGLGYSAGRFVELFGSDFASIVATRREPGEDPAGVRLLVFDGATPSPALREAVAAATHVLVSIPPSPEGDPVIAALGPALREARSLTWIGYLSTIGVYGDAGGGWVDEATPPGPTSERNRRRVGAEADWLELGRGRGTPVQLFRLSGIYGPGQNAVENVEAGSARRIVKPGQVFNRIHVDDIAGAVRAGIDRPAIGPVINVTDDEPAPPQDVVAYAAALLGLEPPPEIPFEEADLTAMGRSFYGDNKRVSNRRLRQDLGYDLRFPTYREGLRACAAVLRKR